MEYEREQAEEHEHYWRDVDGFVPGTKQTCVCGAYRYPTVDDEEPDREPSAQQEKDWNEQYDGTSMGA
jgi:hypothetical protein